MKVTKQSKHHSQSDDIWFKKTNYPGEWLSTKSKNIINQLKNKNMKKLLFTLLLPLFSFAQFSHLEALNFQNNIRSYYNITNLLYSPDLALEAQMWANYIAETDQFILSDDSYGESVFWTDKNYAIINGKDVLLEASLNWALDSSDGATYNQMIYKNATQVGFGVAESVDGIYVVAKYDKLYE